ncbi:DUF502 domain-containing protein [Xanthobacter sp. KR7-225]|uniref:DUF502 domain-containing protein n=1 Tax=Xanthobacter sp. KR7-225 TaxID=3156613 RepID=UPI0032B40B06
MGHLQRTILAGILAFLPLAITIWAVGLILDLLSGVGRPLVNALAGWAGMVVPKLTDVLTSDTVAWALAIVTTILLFYLLGLLTRAVIGQRLLGLVDTVMNRVPVVESLYRAVRQLLASFEARDGGSQRVVLIEFPSPQMKTIGLVTRVFTDVDSGAQIAAVYVPTTPNPTSGYMELVPVERLVWLDWTASEAMQFIVSGGTAAPNSIRFNGNTPPPPAG